MLHVDPHHRIPATEVLQHKWVTSRDQLPRTHHLAARTDSEQLKKAMRATYQAIHTTPVPMLEPVHASNLAQRRSLKLSRLSGIGDGCAGLASDVCCGMAAGTSPIQFASTHAAMGSSSAGVGSVTEAMSATSVSGAPGTHGAKRAAN